MLPLTEVGASPSLSAEGSVTGFGLAGPVQDRSAERSPICSMPGAGQRRTHTGKDVTPLVSTIEHTRLSQDSYGALGRDHWATLGPGPWGVGQSRPVGIGHLGRTVIPHIALDTHDQCCDESVSFRQPIISESSSKLRFDIVLKGPSGGSSMNQSSQRPGTRTHGRSATTKDTDAR